MAVMTDIKNTLENGETLAAFIIGNALYTIWQNGEKYGISVKADGATFGHYLYSCGSYREAVEEMAKVYI